MMVCDTHMRATTKTLSAVESPEHPSTKYEYTCRHVTCTPYTLCYEVREGTE
jgi:hypothetical protein